MEAGQGIAPGGVLLCKPGADSPEHLQNEPTGAHLACQASYECQALLPGSTCRQPCFQRAAAAGAVMAAAEHCSSVSALIIETASEAKAAQHAFTVDALERVRLLSIALGC